MNASLAENYAKFVAKFPRLHGSGEPTTAGSTLCLGGEGDFCSWGDLTPADAAQLNIAEDSIADFAAKLESFAGTSFPVIVYASQKCTAEGLCAVLPLLASVLAPQGLLLCTLPMAGVTRRDDPVSPLGALIKRAVGAGLYCCDAWPNERGSRYDMVLVLQRKDEELRRPLENIRIYPQATLAPGTATQPANTTKEPCDSIHPALVGYQQIIKELHQRIAPRLYYEIGIRGGNNLRLVQRDAIAIGQKRFRLTACQDFSLK